MAVKQVRPQAMYRAPISGRRGTAKRRIRSAPAFLPPVDFSRLILQCKGFHSWGAESAGIRLAGIESGISHSHPPTWVEQVSSGPRHLGGPFSARLGIRMGLRDEGDSYALHACEAGSVHNVSLLNSPLLNSTLRRVRGKWPATFSQQRVDGKASRLFARGHRNLAGRRDSQATDSCPP